MSHARIPLRYKAHLLFSARLDDIPLAGRCGIQRVQCAMEGYGNGGGGAARESIYSSLNMYRFSLTVGYTARRSERPALGVVGRQGKSSITVDATSYSATS